jgi:hypothetical protein
MVCIVPTIQSECICRPYCKKKQMTRSLPHSKNVRQQSINDFWHSLMVDPVDCEVTVSQNLTIGRLSIEKWWWQHYYCVLKISVNRASTTSGLVWAVWRRYPIIALSAAFLGKTSCNKIGTTSYKCASGEGQRL